MLTYQLQRRVLMKTDKSKNFIFPNDVEIEIMFKPSTQFGNVLTAGKTVKKGSTGKFHFDANTGKTSIECDQYLKPLDVTIEWSNLKLQLKANKLLAETRCETRKELHDWLVNLHYILPILLNLELAEPPVVKYTRGKIGDVEFGWELGQGNSHFDVTDDEVQEKRVADSFLRLGQISSRRLGSAIYHFYVARRLAESGNSPFEFMAEIILNYSKILQFLFGESHDEIRAELLKCGYSKKMIEKYFISIMKLRDQFDVGHISFTIFKQEQLDALYRFLKNSEVEFGKLLKKLFEQVKNKKYVLKSDPDIKLKGKKLRTIKHLMQIFQES